MKRVRPFRVVLDATGETVADGAWFAVDESVTVAYRGGWAHHHPEGLDGVRMSGVLANHVEWDDEPDNDHYDRSPVAAPSPRRTPAESS